MKFTGDYHMHTYASDGNTGAREMAEAAQKKGLGEIVISDHSFKQLFWNMTLQKLEAQHADIDAVNADSDVAVRVLKGIEGNVSDARGHIDVPADVVRRLDVLTVGFHRFLTVPTVFKSFGFLVFNGWAARPVRNLFKKCNTKAFIAAMDHYPIDIIAHLGHRTPVNFGEVCAAAKEHSVYIELNVKHLDTIEEGIGEAVDSGVNFIVGSDSHCPETVGGFEAVEQFVKKHNIPVERVFGIEGNMPTFKDKSGWEYAKF